MKTIVISGATTGIGFAIAKACLNNGYRVIGIGRSENKIKLALNELNRVCSNQNILYFKADLAEQAEVLQVTREIRNYLDIECHGELFGLINNVGCVKSWYATNQKGYELQFATNHLASFLLTHELLPYLIKAKGRILMTSSKSHKLTRMRWHDIMFEKHYHPLLAYKQSKLCNLLFAHSINQLYSNQGVRAYGIDPGLVNTRIGMKETGALVNLIWSLRRKSGVSPEIPAATYLWILNQEQAPEDFYYFKSNPTRYSKQVNDENAQKLFKLSEDLCKIRYGGIL